RARGVGARRNLHRVVEADDGVERRTSQNRCAVTERPVAVVSPADHRAGVSPRARVVAAHGNLDRVGEPADRRRLGLYTGSDGDRSVSMLPAGIVSPADDASGGAPGASVRATYRDFNGICDAGNCIRVETESNRRNWDA